MQAAALGTIALNGPVFRRNIAALSPRQPALAARLRSVELPPAARVARGRDNHPVIQLAETDGHVEWLGGTSMPSISGPALAAGFEDRGGGVVLAGIGSGYEPTQLAGRIGAASAVFVAEPDLVHVVLGLAIVDCAALIDAGRLFFLVGEVESAITELLDAYPGLSFPAHIFADALVPKDVIPRLTTALRSAGQGVAERQSQARLALSGQFRPGDVRPATRRIAVLSADAVGSAVAHHADVAAGLAALGHAVDACVPDSPLSTSMVARWQALVRHRTDGILFLNDTSACLGQSMPDDVGAASWYLPSAALSTSAFDGLAEQRLVFAASGEVRSRLIEHGASASTVRVVETGLPDAIFDASAAVTGHEHESERTDAIIAVCDVSPISTSAANIGLESHQRLWRHLLVQIEELGRAGGSPNVDNLLTRAECDTDTPLSDQRLRNEFRGLLAGRLVKTALVRPIIARLAERAQVGLWGAGWDEQDDWEAHGKVEAIWRGPVPGSRERWRRLRRARVAVIPWGDPLGVRTVLECLAVGTVPLWREPPGALLAEYPQSGRLLARIPSFRSIRDLHRQLDACLSPDKALVADMSAWRAEMDVRHRLSVRLAGICKAIYPAPA